MNFAPKMGMFAPNMGAMPLLSTISSALFGKTRRAVLALLYSHPDRQFGMWEITAAAGAGQGAVQRELTSGESSSASSSLSERCSLAPCGRLISGKIAQNLTKTGTRPYTTEFSDRLLGG